MADDGLFFLLLYYTCCTFKIYLCRPSNQGYCAKILYIWIHIWITCSCLLNSCYSLILTHFFMQAHFLRLVAIWTQEVFSLAVSNTYLQGANELVRQCRPTTDTLTLSCEICLFLFDFVCGCFFCVEDVQHWLKSLSSKSPVTSPPDPH